MMTEKSMIIGDRQVTAIPEHPSPKKRQSESRAQPAPIELINGHWIRGVRDDNRDAIMEATGTCNGTYDIIRGMPMVDVDAAAELLARRRPDGLILHEGEAAIGNYRRLLSGGYSANLNKVLEELRTRARVATPAALKARRLLDRLDADELDRWVRVDDRVRETWSFQVRSIRSMLCECADDHPEAWTLRLLIYRGDVPEMETSLEDDEAFAPMEPAYGSGPHILDCFDD